MSDREEYRNKTKGIIVIALAMDALNLEMDTFIKGEIDKAQGSTLVKKYAPNESFYVRGPLGLVKGTMDLVDDECVGSVIKDDKVTLDIYSQEKDEKGKVTSFGIMPAYTINTTLTALLAEHTDKEMTLEDFMGTRFAYNSRVCSNMNQIIKDVKATK